MKIYLIRNNNAESWSGTTWIETKWGAFESLESARDFLFRESPFCEKMKRTDYMGKDEVENYTYFSILALDLN